MPHVPKYEPPDLGADSSPSGAPESEQAGEEDAGSSSSQQQGLLRLFSVTWLGSFTVTLGAALAANLAQQ